MAAAEGDVLAPSTASGAGADLREFETVRVTRDGRIAIIQLNRPDKLNAINPQMRADVIRALDWLRSGPPVAVVLLTSSSPRGFSAGADLEELNALDGPGLRERDLREGRQLTDEVAGFPALTVAVLHGYVLGGGLELALACDLRIAATTARLGLPELRHGFMPGSGGTQRLPRLVGVGRALHLILTAEHVDGRTALAYGLVDWAVDEHELDDVAQQLARSIAQYDATAVRLAIQAVREGVTMPLAAGLRHEKALNYSLMAGRPTSAPQPGTSP